MISLWGNRCVNELDLVIPQCMYVCKYVFQNIIPYTKNMYNFCQFKNQFSCLFDPGDWSQEKKWGKSSGRAEKARTNHKQTNNFRKISAFREIRQYNNEKVLWTCYGLPLNRMVMEGLAKWVALTWHWMQVMQRAQVSAFSKFKEQTGQGKALSSPSEVLNSFLESLAF